MMLSGSVAASQASFPVHVSASDGIVLVHVEIVSGAARPNRDALRVTVRELPASVLERGLRIVARGEVLDPFSNASVYPAFYDEWPSTELTGRPVFFDLALPMSLTYFLAPISMEVIVAAM